MERQTLSLDEKKSPSRWSVPDDPMFVRDPSGQSVFYVIGPRFRGYVVPDVQREWALRNAVKRFEEMQISFAYFGVPLIPISIFSLDGPYSNFALALLTVTLVVAAIGRVLQRRWCFGDLLAGLDRVEPLDPVGRRIVLRNLSLVLAAYCSFVGWRVVQAIQSHSF